MSRQMAGFTCKGSFTSRQRAPEIVEEQIGPRTGGSQISVFPYSRYIIEDKSTLQGSSIAQARPCTQ
ncbi:hypothetical protein TNIN_392721 [Trichonephila inaurata madagascariensis]|uniref:Uncharacterized protein n=1 Tax=Trichonephila inaurata madagascariensis TaxID=2747483 RepID=A0A8X6WZF9_9ARAC|nr:hypothetical protein TNIN_392721 [Trichonephila inaurata madagascariensis]